MAGRSDFDGFGDAWAQRAEIGWVALQVGAAGVGAVGGAVVDGGVETAAP